MRVVQPICLTLMLIGSGSAAQAQVGEFKTPDQIEMKAPLRPGGPAGAVLYGDPTKQGLYVNRATIAKGQKNMPHSHPDERVVVVLSGTFYVGFGEQFDESKMKALPAGSFFTEPPNAPHYNWAKDGDVVVQITGIGPSGTKSIPAK
jgi:quercetin dioxygenase-like cupin family protein